METKANYALIGAFTLAVIAAGVLFVFWFSRASTSEGRVTYKVVFTTSVSGLSRGSQVLFNGVRVGEVTSVQLDPDDPTQVEALIAVSANTPVKEDTGARLEYQGLTGVAAIALTGGSATASPLLSPDKKPATISAERSELQNIMETVQRFSGRMDGILDKADKLLGDNSGAIASTVRNVDAFSKALADNSDGVKQFLSTVGDLGSSMKPVVANLENLSKSFDERIKAIDPDRVRSIVGNADQISSKLNGAIDKADKLLADIGDNSGAFASTVRNVETFSKALADNSDGVKQFLSTVGDLGSSLKPVVANLEDVSKSFDERIKAIDPDRVRSIVSNADQISAKLKGTVDKFDNLLVSLDGFVGKGDAKGVMTDVADAAKSIRKLADNLDVRTKELAVGINRFTGAGLRQYEALASDGRKTLDELNRTLRSLEKNPQQLIFGRKPAIPEYRGR